MQARNSTAYFQLAHFMYVVWKSQGKFDLPVLNRDTFTLPPDPSSVFTYVNLFISAVVTNTRIEQSPL
jgi:hypothetical protein